MPSPSPSRVPALIGALIGALVAAGVGGSAAAGEPLDTLVVGSAPAAATLVAQGQVVAVRQALLAAQAAGRVTEVLVRSGESVRRGQVLLRIDAPASQAAAEAGGAQANAAAAQLASARAEFQRVKRLHDKDYLSDAALERAEAQLKSLEAQATATAAQARAAREVAGWAELRAPYDGRVTAVNVAAGDLAAPGQPLMGMYAPGALRVMADVPEDVSGQLDTDQPAHLTYEGGGCGAAPRATKNWIMVSAIDPRSRSVEVRVEIAESPGCLPGTLARVSLPVKGARPVILVPASAVVRRGELDAVYVVDGSGRESPRQVRLGASTGENLEILAGLEPGERVVRAAVHLRPTAAAGSAAP